MCSNFEQTLFSTTKNTQLFVDGIKKYANSVLSDTTDETISNFEQLTLGMPSTEINSYFFNVLSAPAAYKKNCTKCKNATTANDVDNNETDTCNKIKINIEVDSKKNAQSKTNIKKQKNISFSNEKLWEINRVNRILHNKISNGVKPNYSRQSPTLFVKATSTINRERKNKDIIKGNEVSFKI